MYNSTVQCIKLKLFNRQFERLNCENLKLKLLNRQFERLNCENLKLSTLCAATSIVRVMQDLGQLPAFSITMSQPPEFAQVKPLPSDAQAFMAQFTAQQPAQPTQPSSAFDMSGMMSFMMQQQQQMQQQWQQQQQEFARQLEQQRYEEEKRRRIEDEQRRQEFERYRKEEEERHRQEEQRRREEEDQRRRDAERPDSRASNSSRSSTFSTASKQEIRFENDSRAFGIHDPADFWQLPQVIALMKYCKV